MALNDVIVGGVSYPAGLVAGNSYNKKNNTYEVTLTTGVKLEYKEQKNARVSGFTHGLFSDCCHLQVNGMVGGKIAGSENDDSITLDNCQNLTVDVSNDPRNLFGGDRVEVIKRNDKKLNICIFTNVKDDKVRCHEQKDKKTFVKKDPYHHYDQTSGKYVYQI